MTERSRPDWDLYFMKIAKVVGSRSNCKTRQLGAIVVRDKLILSTGYNGTPRNLQNCNEGGCPRCNDTENYKTGTQLDKCFCVHAEENSIIQAAYHGASVRDATIYTFFTPCIFCTKTIINAGIKHVIANERYSADDDSRELLKKAGVKLTIFDNPVT